MRRGVTIAVVRGKNPQKKCLYNCPKRGANSDSERRSMMRLTRRTDFSRISQKSKQFTPVLRSRALMSSRKPARNRSFLHCINTYGAPPRRHSSIFYKKTRGLLNDKVKRVARIQAYSISVSCSVPCLYHVNNVHTLQFDILIEVSR